VVPEIRGPDYEVLKKRLYEFKETVFVDDYIEIKNMISELNAIDPVRITNEFVPKLEKLIQESNGRLKSYYIWPHHLEGGMDLIYPGGRRYPKRLR
jgi:hypothetical protein